MDIGLKKLTETSPILHGEKGAFLSPSCFFRDKSLQQVTPKNLKLLR